MMLSKNGPTSLKCNITVGKMNLRTWKHSSWQTSRSRNCWKRNKSYPSLSHELTSRFPTSTCLLTSARSKRAMMASVNVYVGTGSGHVDCGATAMRALSQTTTKMACMMVDLTTIPRLWLSNSRTKAHWIWWEMSRGSSLWETLKALWKLHRHSTTPPQSARSSTHEKKERRNRE